MGCVLWDWWRVWRRIKPVFGESFSMDSFDLYAKGSFDAGSSILISPRRAFRAMPDPETVKCESCGTPVFLLSVRGPDVPEFRHWMEPCIQTGPGRLEIPQHTPERCQAAREASE